MIRRLSLAAFLFAASFALPSRSLADETPTPEEERATAFEAVEGADREHVSGLGMMVSAYALVWAFAMLYFVRLGRIEARLAEDVERLEKKLGSD